MYRMYRHYFHMCCFFIANLAFFPYCSPAATFLIDMEVVVAAAVFSASNEIYKYYVRVFIYISETCSIVGY